MWTCTDTHLNINKQHSEQTALTVISPCIQYSTVWTQPSLSDAIISVNTPQLDEHACFRSFNSSKHTRCHFIGLSMLRWDGVLYSGPRTVSCPLQLTLSGHARYWFFWLSQLYCKMCSQGNTGLWSRGNLTADNDWNSVAAHSTLIVSNTVLFCT